jgi:hypothetical protein
VLVEIRFRAAQLVVHMQDGGGKASFSQSMQQKNGIGATRYRYADAPEPE